MSKRITVHKDKQPIYDIVIENSFSGLLPELKKLRAERKRICIVTDAIVGPLYEKIICEELREYVADVMTVTVPSGETYKTLDTVRQLYQTLIEAKFDRNDMLLALGGGVIGDLTGFAAATYLRGIDFIQVPTTLLAQVDSSVGGKTGVDFDGYKNMVGAFCMPRLVYMNVSALNTLDTRCFLSGMGEVIKYGLIRHPDFYQWLLEHIQDIKEKCPESLEYMISVSCDTKRKIVEEDPTERGIRALLNFGHTLGHAIEKKKDFTMFHGECVALGMVAAAYISHKKGILSLEKVKTLKALLKAFGLPVTTEGLNVEEVLEITKNDKKMIQGTIQFILLRTIGDGYIDCTVTKEDMTAGLRYIGCCAGSEAAEWRLE